MGPRLALLQIRAFCVCHLWGAEGQTLKCVCRGFNPCSAVGSVEGRGSLGLFHLCCDDDGRTSWVVDFPHPCGGVVPISRYRNGGSEEGAQSQCVCLITRKEGTDVVGFRFSGLHGDGSQPKLPAPKLSAGSSLQEGQTGNPQEFQRPGLWLKWSGPQL